MNVTFECHSTILPKHREYNKLYCKKKELQISLFHKVSIMLNHGASISHIFSFNRNKELCWNAALMFQLLRQFANPDESYRSGWIVADCRHKTRIVRTYHIGK